MKKNRAISLKTKLGVKLFLARNKKLFLYSKSTSEPLSFTRAKISVLDNLLSNGIKRNFIDEKLAIKIRRKLVTLEEVAQYKGMKETQQSIVKNLASKDGVGRLDLRQIEEFRSNLISFKKNSLLIKKGKVEVSEVDEIIDFVTNIYRSRHLPNVDKTKIYLFKSKKLDDLVVNKEYDLIEIGSKESSVKSGVNEAFFVVNKKKISAVYKPVKNSGKEIKKLNKDGLNYFGIKPATLHHREVAAYKVDQILNLNIVPPTYYANLKKGIGSVQEFVEQSESFATILSRKGNMANPLRLRVRPSQLDEKIAILDIVTGNMDRHLGNLMLNKHGGSAAIDNGLSFPLRLGNGDKAGFYVWNWINELHRSFSKESLSKISKIDIKNLRDVLKNKHFIEPAALDLMEARIKVLKEVIEKNPKVKISDVAEMVLESQKKIK